MNSLQKFHWFPLDDCEDLDNYKPGWYHPVHIGDKYPADKPRYRILNKLGYGTFSTVWLAEHIPSGRAVALKILIADLKNSSESQEIRILQSLPRLPHLLEILDSFTISGPNGEHDVVVSEVLFPARVVWNTLWCRTGFRSKQILRQLLEGTAILHEHGIVHGDLHFENLAFRFPEVAEMDAKTWLDRLPPPHVIPVLSRDAKAALPSSHPGHIVAAVWMGSLRYNFKKASESGKGPIAVIADFGVAYYMSNPPLRRSVLPPLHFRPPELYFIAQERDRDTDAFYKWGAQGDIWSLACTMHQLKYGMVPFTGAFSERALVCYLHQELGPLPPFLHRLLSEEDLDKPFPPTSLKRKGGRVRDLILRMLECDPTRRPSARDLLQHPYFPAEGKSAPRDQQATQETMHRT